MSHVLQKLTPTLPLHPSAAGDSSPHLLPADPSPSVIKFVTQNPANIHTEISKL